jgi:hypothetical protein
MRDLSSRNIEVLTLRETQEVGPAGHDDDRWADPGLAAWSHRAVPSRITIDNPKR